MWRLLNPRRVGEELGLLQLTAKARQRPNSRKAGNSEPFHFRKGRGETVSPRLITAEAEQASDFKSPVAPDARRARPFDLTVPPPEWDAFP